MRAARKVQVFAVKPRLRTALVLGITVALAACRGGSSTAGLPSMRTAPHPLAAAAASVTQWANGSAYAPASIKISWAAAPAAGDMLVVALWNNGQASGAANTYTPPAGWTLVDQNTSHAYATYQTFSHVAAAGEANGYVFTPAAAARQQVWMAADVAGATASDAHGNAFITSSTAFTSPSVTPTQSNDLAIAFNMPMT